MIKLRNSHVLILGGSSGIGKAIAHRLVSEGARVVIAGRNIERLEIVRRELAFDNLYTLECDISNISSHEDIFACAERLMDGLNAFVNTAVIGTNVICGEGREWEPFDITEEEWDVLADTNFKAAYFLMRNEILYLKNREIKGNILNFSSNAMCMDVVGHYGAAKLAITKWTRAFGKQYGRDGIIINGIAPGAVVTPLIAHYAKSIEQPYPRHSIGRFIRPDEIAELAFYLMSNYGEIICGHTVVADGGDTFAM